MRSTNYRLRNSNKKSLGLLIVILSLVFTSFMGINSINPINAGSSSGIDEIIGEDHNNDLTNKIKTSATSSWWNASYRYRVEVNLTETGYSNRSNEPVDLFMSFND